MKWIKGTFQTPELRIQITNSHIHAKDEWVIHVRELGWNTKRLIIPNESTEQEAQKAAILAVKSHIEDMLHSLEDK